MTKRARAVVVAKCLAFLVGGCGGTLGASKATKTNAFEASTVAGAVQASNAFGFELYGRARADQDNFVCSPAGAAIALTMAAAGARGATQAEMLRTLHIDPAQLGQTYASFAAILAALNARNGQDGLVLTVADRAWAQKGLGFRREYLSLLGETFHAPVAQVDFIHASDAALEAINRWAADETHGRIPRILEALSEETLLVLANAVYLKGGWQRPFQANDTRDGGFATAKGQVSTKMMRQVTEFRYAEVDGAKLVELAYRGGVSMIVVLPEHDDGLSQIEERLAGSYADWIGKLAGRLVDLELPRFTSTTTLDLVSLLQAMGMRLAFYRGSADFSGMVTNPGASLFIGDAVQKAWIETNEIGTEAAAVTAVTGDDLSDYEEPEPKPVIFHANHPFLYVIRDMASGAILFVGRVVQPD